MCEPAARRERFSAEDAVGKHRIRERGEKTHRRKHHDHHALQRRIDPRFRSLYADYGSRIDRLAQTALRALHPDDHEEAKRQHHQPWYEQFAQELVGIGLAPRQPGRASHQERGCQRDRQQHSVVERRLRRTRRMVHPALKQRARRAQCHDNAGDHHQQDRHKKGKVTGDERLAGRRACRHRSQSNQPHTQPQYAVSQEHRRHEEQPAFADVVEGVYRKHLPVRVVAGQCTGACQVGSDEEKPEREQSEERVRARHAAT